jgi:hypothetical protein
MPKYSVGLEVNYVVVPDKKEHPNARGALVAYIGEDPGNPGSELWWAWLGTEKLGRVSVGKHWMPTDSVCRIPVPGWRCTRGAFHDGPCAAVPDIDWEKQERGGR